MPIPPNYRIPFPSFVGNPTDGWRAKNGEITSTILRSYLLGNHLHCWKCARRRKVQNLEIRVYEQDHVLILWTNLENQLSVISSLARRFVHFKGRLDQLMAYQMGSTTASGPVTIPVVDISKYYSGGSAAKNAIADEIREAYENQGFLQACFSTTSQI